MDRHLNDPSRVGIVITAGFFAFFNIPVANAVISKDLADCPLSAPSDTIVHSQGTTGTELVMDCPHDPDPFPHNFITRFYNGTNATSEAWIGYEFDVSLLAGGVAGGSFGWDPNEPPLLTVPGDVPFNDELARILFDDALAPNGSFTVLLRFGEYTAGTARVQGTPVRVPEPGVLSLFIAALVGLLIAPRSRMHKLLVSTE